MEQSLIDRAVRMMMHTDRMHRHAIEQRVGDIGLHRTAHMMLMHLAKTETKPSQRELADHFSITPAAVTGILKHLERDGYITRTVGRDTRFHEIAITDKGRDVVKKSRELFYEVDCEMFSGFTDEEIEVYILALTKIQANLNGRKEQK